MRVGVIGLGSIGLGVAKSLLSAGHEVIGVDLSEERRELFGTIGGKSSGEGQDAAKEAECVFSVVVNDAQTEEVLFGDNGIADVMPENSVFVSCATVPPRSASSLAVRLEQRHRHYLDAPTSGGPAKAMSGEITLMASGSPEAFEKAGPLLDVIASKVYRLGDEAGAGSAMKLVNQLLAGVHIATACEAIAFAIRLGLDPEQVYEVITSAAGSSWMFENRVPHILQGDYTPKSAVGIFTKDLGIVLEAARERQFPVPMASMGLQMFEMAAAAGMTNEDDSSIARIYALLAGISLPAGTENK